MQLDVTDLSPKCYMATLSRHFEINFPCQGEFEVPRIIGGEGGPSAPPPIILKERLGRVRLAAHGLSFSIINKSPGTTHKYVFRETLPSISAGTGMGTGGNRVLRIYTICCLA